MFYASVAIKHGTYGGSGTVIWVESGYAVVLTCKHLFEGTAGTLSVTIPGQPPVRGELIGTSMEADLAAVLIPATARTVFVPFTETGINPHEKLAQLGYPKTHDAKRGPHFRSGTYIEGSKTTRCRMSTPFVSGDSGGGIFKADKAECVGVAIHSDGGFVGCYQCGTFINDVCKPWFRKRVPGGWGNKQPPITPPSVPPVMPPAVDLAPVMEAIAVLAKEIQALKDRPGIPGPPGLPGRDGLDGPAGKPGADGKPGRDGLDADNRAIKIEVEALRADVTRLQGIINSFSGSVRIQVAPVPKR